MASETRLNWTPFLDNICKLVGYLNVLIKWIPVLEAILILNQTGRVWYSDPQCIFKGMARVLGLVPKHFKTRDGNDYAMGECSSLVAHWHLIPGDCGSNPGMGKQILYFRSQDCLWINSWICKVTMTHELISTIHYLGTRIQGTINQGKGPMLSTS